MRRKHSDIQEIAKHIQHTLRGIARTDHLTRKNRSNYTVRNEQAASRDLHTRQYYALISD